VSKILPYPLTATMAALPHPSWCDRALCALSIETDGIYVQHRREILDAHPLHVQLWSTMIHSLATGELEETEEFIDAAGWNGGVGTCLADARRLHAAIGDALALAAAEPPPASFAWFTSTVAA